MKKSTWKTTGEFTDVCVWQNSGEVDDTAVVIIIFQKLLIMAVHFQHMNIA